MQRLEVSCAVRRINTLLGTKGLKAVYLAGIEEEFSSSSGCCVSSVYKVHTRQVVLKVNKVSAFFFLLLNSHC